MGKQRLRTPPPGRFEESPVTADPKRTKDLDFAKPNSLLKSQGIYNANAKSSFEGIVESPFESDYFNVKAFGMDLGDVDDSAFSPLNFRDPFNKNIDFEKIRADKQSTISKFGNTGIQYLGKTAIGVVGNLIGSLYGFGKAIAEGDSGQIFDNSVFRTLDEWTEAVEAKNTVFLNRKKGLGLNFELYKDVSDAFSFISSAALSEMAIQSVGNLIGGAGLATLPGRMGRYIRTMSSISSKLDNAQDLEKLALEFGTTVEKLSKTKRNLDLTKGLLEIPRKILTTTGYEASLEARGVQDEMLQKAENDVNKFLQNKDWSDEEKLAYKAEYMKKAEEVAHKAGLTTFGLNTAILGASNMMQFPTIFGSSYLKARRLYSLEREALGTVKRAEKGKLLRGLSTTARVLSNPTTEFFEETLQGVSAKTSKHYYETMLETETNKGVLSPLAASWANSLWHGLKETYGTEEGLHEGVIGAIVGAIGLPGFKRVGKKNKFSWNGGIYGSIKDLQKRKHQTESAIENLNSVKMSDSIMYNRDNAIIATVDADREDMAVLNEDPIEFEAAQDNKVFRYVTDRMKKGVEDFIDEDVQELQNMDLETYKKTFDKEESFTQEQKDKEVSDFSNKVDIYRKAFKVAHKTLDFGDYHYDNLAYNKLTDILTHALATEKVYATRLEELKQALYSLNTEISREEIDSFVETSAKIRTAQWAIDKYIKNKTQSKNQKKIEETLPEEFRWLLNLDKDQLLDMKEGFTNVAELSETGKTQLDNINKTLKLLETMDPMDANKSSVVRKKRENLQELADEINNQIEGEVSESMKQLGALPKKVTVKELEEYLNIRPELSKQINEKHKSTTTLDRVDTFQDRDILEEIKEITARFTTATEVAASLYGLRGNPKAMYAKILGAELYANVKNTHRKAIELHFLALQGEDETLLKPLVDELEDDMETLQSQLSKSKEYLSDKGITMVEDHIKFLEETLELFEKLRETKKNIEKQEKDSKVAVDDSPLDIDGDLAAAGALNDEDTETSEDNSTNPSNKAKKVSKGINRITIKEKTRDGEPAKSNDGYPTLEEALAEGLIKNKAATTLSLVDNQLNPDDNEYLANLLRQEGLLESYKKGYAAVQKDHSLLENPTEDVNTFIRFAPMHMNVYDKVATKTPDGYEFEIEDADSIVYQQFLFTPSLNDIETKMEEQFNKEVAELKKWVKEEKAKKKGKGKSSHTTDANITAEYNKRYADLEAKYLAFNRSITSNISMRTALLANYFNGNNELKLKVHNVDQGNFETFKDRKKVVEEHNVSELGIDADTITIDELLYTDQRGKYVRFDGTKVEDLDDHPMKDQTTGQSNLIHIVKTDKSGRKVPLKMNVTKLTPEDKELILDTLEKYLTFIDKDDFRVTVSPKQNKILANEGPMSMEKFLSFFLKQKRNRAQDPLFIKNTFNLNTKNLPNNQFEFSLLTGGILNINLRFPPADGSNNDKILEIFNERREELGEALLSQRHNINVDFFVDAKGNIKRDNLKIAFEEGLINHPFNVNTNFDDVYDPDYNKGITISRADVDDEASEAVKEATFAEAIKEFRGVVTNKRGDYEANIQDLYFAIERGLRRSLTIKLGHRDDSITRKEKLELLNESIESIVQSKIDQVLEMGKKFPGQLTVGKEHETNTKINTSDKLLDQLLKHLYYFKNTALQDKYYKKQIIDRMDNWNAFSKFMNEFRKPPAGSNFKMMSFVPNSEGTAVRNSIIDPKQLESFIRVINILKELTDSKAVQYVDINYSETYPAANGREFSHKYVNPKNLRRKQLSNKHHKTRLKSVQIEEELVWKDGELIQGEVYFNFGKKDKNGKEGNQKVLVLSKNMSIDKATNIMTSMQLPFISSSTFEISERMDQMFQAIQENIGDDLAARNIALSKFPQAKKTEKGERADTWDIDEAEIEDGTKEEVNLSVKEQLEAQGAITEEGKKSKDPKPVKKTNKTLSSKNLNNDSVKKFFKIKLPIYVKRLSNNKELKDSNKETLLKNLKELGIDNLTNYIFALEYLNKENIIEANEDNIKMGEYLFEEKREDCE